MSSAARRMAGERGAGRYNERPDPSMPRPTLPARLLRQRLQALVDALPAATSGDVTSVHRARVASRRLRAVLPVLAEAARSETLARARRQVRRVTRALGPVRELDVALGHLDEIGPRAGVPARALASVRRAIEEQRRRRRTHAGRHHAGDAGAARGRRPRPGATPPPRRRADAEVRAARRRAVRRAAELRAALRDAGPLTSPSGCTPSASRSKAALRARDRARPRPSRASHGLDG